MNKQILQEKEEISNFQKKSDLVDTERNTDKLMQDNTRYTRIGGYALVAVIVIGYIAFQIVGLMKPPTLVIENPEESSVVFKSRITVNGSVVPTSEVTVNGELILTNSEGAFEQTVYLMPGVNQFVFEAKKRYGKPTLITRTVEYREPVVQGGNVRIMNN